ncbi:MAG: hypothetical protein JXA25_12370 [Anaerolineales bacterium]|nr:hypothetical protein [Anaerolineales bacterium]
MPSLSLSDLVDFLLEAKAATYAAGGGGSAAVVDPLLQNSHQLEFHSGSLLYRDIYFGEAFFAGQETVYSDRSAIWSMCYAGGWTGRLSDPELRGGLGAFLQSALREAPPGIPFRGPYRFESVDGKNLYINTPSGSVERFAGVEQIFREDILVYELNYCGGLLK